MFKLQFVCLIPQKHEIDAMRAIRVQVERSVERFMTRSHMELGGFGVPSAVLVEVRRGPSPLFGASTPRHPGVTGVSGKKDSFKTFEGPS